MRKLAFLLPLLIVAQTQTTWSAPAIKEPGVVQIGVSAADTKPAELMKAFYPPIERDTQSRKFRVTWAFYILGSYVRTALYDRDTQTLKYWRRDKSEYGIFTEASLYTNVTDEALQKLFKDLEASGYFGGVPQDSSLGDLQKFGCKRILIRKTDKPS